MAKPDRVTELQPPAEIERNGEQPNDDAGQADTEEALDRLERFLASWSPNNPPLKIPAPARTAWAADRPLVGAGAESPAARPADAKAQDSPGRRVLSPVLVVLAVASLAGAAFGLSGAPAVLSRLTSVPPNRAPDLLKQLPTISFDGASDLWKRLPSVSLDRAPGVLSRLPSDGLDYAKRLLSRPSAVIPAGLQTATPTAADGSGAGASPLHEEEFEPHQNPADAGANGSSPFENVPPPVPAGDASKAGAPQSKPQPGSAVPNRAAESPSENALIATPRPFAAADTPPAAEKVGDPSEPRPKAAEAKATPRPEVPMTAGQSEISPALDGDPKSASAALADAPMPPVRPASLGRPARRERIARAHKAAEEPRVAADPPTPPPETAPPPPPTPANPLLRVFDAFK